MAVVITGDLASIITSSATALGVAYTAWKQWQQDKKLEAQAEALARANELQIANHGMLATVAGSVAAVQTSVAKVEVQSNHLTQTLVEKTALASHAQGVADGVAQAATAAAAAPQPVTIQNIAPIPVINVPQTQP